MPLKFFHATVANADIVSLKYLHTVLKKLFVPHSSEIWTKSYGQNYRIFWAFLFVPHSGEIWTKSYGQNYRIFWAFWPKKKMFKKKIKIKQQQKNIFDKALVPFWRTHVDLKQLFDAKVSNFSFQKLRESDTCNQIKSCTKHGRPD